jgi:lysophospholipase L1-like esterase
MRYVLIGDSQAEGMQPHMRAALNAQTPGWTETAHSVYSGISTRRMIEGVHRLARPARGSRPAQAIQLVSPTIEEIAVMEWDVAIVVLGGNDGNNKEGTVRASSYARVIRRLINLLTPVTVPSRPRPVFWVGPAVVRAPTAGGDRPHPAEFYDSWVANVAHSRAIGLEGDEGADEYLASIGRAKAAVRDVQLRLFRSDPDVTWLDGFALTTGPGTTFTHRPDGVHFLRPGRVQFARNIAAAVNGQPIPTARIGAASHTGSPAATALNNSAEAGDRARNVVQQPRANLYASATRSQEARARATAVREARLVEISERGLRLPVIVNALGFDFTTGMWTQGTSTNASTAPAEPVPPTTDGTTEDTPHDDSPQEADENNPVVDDDDEDVDADITGEEPPRPLGGRIGEI